METNDLIYKHALEVKIRDTIRELEQLTHIRQYRRNFSIPEIRIAVSKLLREKIITFEQSQQFWSEFQDGSGYD